MKCALLNASYTYDSTDNFYSDVSAYLVDGTTPIALTSPAVSIVSDTIVKYDASDSGLVWENVTDTDGVGSAVIYNDTGTPGTSPLIAFLDDANVLAEGGDFRVFLNSNGIFRITT